MVKDEERMAVYRFKDLVEVLFQRPYSKRQFLVDAGIVKVKQPARI
jgi:hypothetical protein